MYFTFCGMNRETMKVLMSSAVSSVVEPLADEVTGTAEGRFGKGLVLKICSLQKVAWKKKIRL